MSRVIKTPGAVISGAPVYPLDPIVRNGSLILIDPKHPANPWPGGVPSGAIPNLAQAQADALVGATTGLSLINGWGAGEGLVERSSKGGLHLAPSTTGSVLNHFFEIAMNAALYNYLSARRTAGDVLYYSIWGKSTRTPQQLTTIGAIRPSASSWITHQIAATTALSQGAPTEGSGLRVGGTFRNVQSQRRVALAGPPNPASTSPVNRDLVRYGATSSAVLNQLGAFLYWRLYVENLTVSGRTFAQVDAIDDALFTQEVLTVGGRYRGDSHTAV